MNDNLHTADDSFDASSRSGGWAFVVMDGDCQIHVAAGAVPGSSNNTFEVPSVVQAASWLASETPAAAVIQTDSASVVKA
jgi:ribonuclease HI